MLELIKQQRLERIQLAASTRAPGNSAPASSRSSPDGDQEDEEQDAQDEVETTPDGDNGVAGGTSANEGSEAGN